ncbi:MAG: hypothetical protein LBT09_00490 [Planctomycetaceae bacterium]|jgi:hypothetical protein|nr:hypothetical protein [Planctomycetaceae bacterium]
MKHLLLLIMLLLVFAGCNRTSIGGLVSARGQVIYDGSPIGGVGIVFTPDAGSGSDRFATGVTKDDGTFELDTVGHKGILPGTYVVTLSKTSTKSKISEAEEKKLLAENKPIPNAEIIHHIPYKYSNPVLSGIKIEIGKDGKKDIKIELTPDNSLPPMSDI